MRRLAWLAGAALLAACAPASEAPDERPRLIAALDWESPDPRHGGLSGIEVGPDGQEVTAITDRSTLIEARIARERGVPVAIEGTRHHSMTTPEGKALTGFAADSEGLAVNASDGVAVSFEGYHRVWRFGRDGAGTARLPLFPPMSGLPTNSGVEALAVDASGRLLALPEEPQGKSFPVWRWGGAAWSLAFTVPRRGPMKMVGADFGPDGRLYLLERRLTPLGFRSRVRRVEADGTGEATLLETPPGRHGNLEGLAVWRDAGGAIRLTMVSDDNFLPFQRGQIVEYRLPPEPLPEAPPERPGAERDVGLGAAARAPLEPRARGG